MKTLITALVVLYTSSNIWLQTNESPMSAYQWKGKKTVLQPGYVILNSDKKLKGQISLKGKDGNVSGIYFKGDGKEIDFPMSAIKSYGVNAASNSGDIGNSGYLSGPLQCENNEELFTWRDMGVQMGKQINNTKPRTGYVIKRDGTLIEGELQVKKVDNVITEFVVKGDKTKFKLPAAEVGRYGLKMTMAELTKDGSKNYNDEAKNFHRGTIELTSGESIEGFVAFKKKTPINPNRPGAGDKYNGMYFAKSESDYVKTFEDNEVSYIKQIVNGKEELYSPYEGGFVSSSTMDNARYSDKRKDFNAGKVTLINGEVITGQVARANNKKINFRSPEGIISGYAPGDLQKAEMTIEGEAFTFITSEGVFVEEIANGNTFWVYINPSPTTINKRRTNLANSAMSAGASLASSAVLNKTEKDLGVNLNLDSILRSTSTEDLVAQREQTARQYGFSSVEAMDEGEIPNETIKRVDFAIQMELAARSSENDVVIYFEEYIVVNKTNNETFILYKDKDLMNDKLEGLLMGCYTFLELDSKEQKYFYDIENIKKTFKMLNDCY